MADENCLHASISYKLQLDSKPLEMFVARLGPQSTAIHSGIMVEEIEGIQTKDCQFLRNNLNEVPASSFKAMPLLLWYELAPDIGVRLQPFVRSREENVVR